MTAEHASRHERRPLVMVDNTLLAPTFQHPFALGADVALYSATKYLCGFSDIIGGIALMRDTGLMAKMRSKRSLFGNILQPDECWMLNSRLATVALRMNRQSKNAQRIAEQLAQHPKIKRVYYPTLFEDRRAAAHLQGAVRLSRRRVLARLARRQAGGVRLSAQPADRRAMRSRWAEWRRWSATRRRRRIRALTEQQFARGGRDGGAGADLGRDRGLAGFAGRLRAGVGGGLVQPSLLKAGCRQECPPHTKLFCELDAGRFHDATHGP